MERAKEEGDGDLLAQTGNALEVSTLCCLLTRSAFRREQTRYPGDAKQLTLPDGHRQLFQAVHQESIMPESYRCVVTSRCERQTGLSADLGNRRDLVWTYHLFCIKCSSFYRRCELFPSLALRSVGANQLTHHQNYKKRPIQMYNPHKAPLLDHYR